MPEDLQEFQFESKFFRAFMDADGNFRMQIRKGFHHFITLAGFSEANDPPDDEQWWELHAPDTVEEISAIFGGDGPPCM